MANPSKMLTVQDFTNHPEVLACMQELEAAFPQKSIMVSDVLDKEGNQYVNLVQEGGGVLGMALVGYTYVLEQMNIRFIRMAGASAGAINTALMTISGKKEEAKSTKVLKEICDLNFFDLVDGHPVMRWLIKHFITNKNFGQRVKSWITRTILALVLLLVCDFIFLGLEHMYPTLSTFTKIFFVLTSMLLAGILIFIYYISSLSERLKNNGLGINPGDYFYDWIKAKMRSEGVITVSDLINKASEEIPGLYLRGADSKALINIKGDVTFITSELVSQNKIQFPAMCNLFRRNIDDLQPAGFVRASMSIPVFFESYFIDEIPVTDEYIKQQWLETFDEPEPPEVARFVDGGILSNFPISIFFDPEVRIPQLPTFGIDLNDGDPNDNSNRNTENWTLGSYFGRMLTTIKGYYDKDFLLKNKVFRKGIGTIQLAGFNWLNFFLTDQDKIDMFIRGARAATEFLKTFDWDEYKNNHSSAMKQFQSTMKPKN